MPQIAALMLRCLFPSSPSPCGTPVTQALCRSRSFEWRNKTKHLIFALLSLVSHPLHKKGTLCRHPQKTTQIWGIPFQCFFPCSGAKLQ